MALGTFLPFNYIEAKRVIRKIADKTWNRHQLQEELSLSMPEVTAPDSNSSYRPECERSVSVDH